MPVREKVSSLQAGSGTEYGGDPVGSDTVTVLSSQLAACKVPGMRGVGGMEGC